MSWLDRLHQAGLLRPIDRELGRVLARLDPERAEAVGSLAALASRALAEGHTCLDLSGDVLPAEADGVIADEAPDAELAPPAARWRDVLATSPLVSDGSDPHAPPTPLVLRGDMLWLARQDADERALAARLIEIASTPVPSVPVEVLDPLVERLFEGFRSARQEDAVRAAVGRSLCVLAGGPGTGKTTTVVRVLAAIAELAVSRRARAPRVLLLAPTGKAAARLGESMAKQVGTLALAPASEAVVRASLPVTASTIHRALGRTGRWLTLPRHDAERPWAADVVVIDEVSMVDLSLMAKVVAALKPGARLVLLGDPDQLAAVGAGAVLADLVDRALPAEIATGVVQLVGSRRYAEDSAVGSLAAAIHAGDADAAVRVLDAGGDTALVVPSGRPDRSSAVLAHAVEGFGPALSGETPAERLDGLERFRVLCALRGGPSGVAAMNAAIEGALARAGRVVLDGEFYVGRPVLVTENDPGTHLSNGDVGVVGVDAAGQRRVFFASTAGDGMPRAIVPARLPAHETAWATTIHKSQGSEFDRVLIVLPDADHPLVTRELVYTAVTRARRGVILVADAHAVRASLPRRALRRSGLRAALARAVSTRDPR